jgi:hypothetical protein
MVVAIADLAAWQAVIAKGQITDITCATCKCEHGLVDGGDHVGQARTPKPRLDSIDVGTGSAAGGTTVTLTGHALNVGTLVVKFSGIAASIVGSPSSSHAVVTSPAGNFKLLTQGAVTGALSPGDTITGMSSGKTATIVSVGSGFLIVSSPSGAFTSSEVVQKDGSNHVQLSDAADPLINNPVDVTVENENGQKKTGGALAGAFAYTLP